MIYKCLPGNHGSCQNRPARGALPSRPNQSPAVTATASCVVTAGLVTPASSSRHAIPSVPASRATSPPLAKQVSLEFLSSTTCSAPPINPSSSSNSASPSPSFFYQRCPVNLGRSEEALGSSLDNAVQGPSQLPTWSTVFATKVTVLHHIPKGARNECAELTAHACRGLINPEQWSQILGCTIPAV